MIEELLSQGIHLKNHKEGNQKTKCPRCGPGRKNKHDESLSVKITGDQAVWNCHNCYWSGSAGKISSAPAKPRFETAEEVKAKNYKKPVVAPGEYTTEFPPEVMKYLTETRKLTPEVIKKNKLAYCPKSKAVCFPYYESLEDYNSSKLTNIKHRPWQEKKMWQTEGAKQIFYGLQDVIGKEEIIIVEGEYDKLALNVCGFDNVISVPGGAPQKEVTEADAKKFEFLIHAEELLARVKRVIIAVDNDAPGKILERELARRIGVEKCWSCLL